MELYFENLKSTNNIKLRFFNLNIRCQFNYKALALIYFLN